MDLQLRSLEARLADRRLTLDVTQDAKDWLVDNGFDPIYGARPLRRLVQTAIGDELAKQILSGKTPDGSNVLVDAKDGVLTVAPE